MLSRGGSVKRKATRKTVCPLNRIEQRPSSVRKRIGGSRGRLLISGSDRRCLSPEELLPDGVAEGFICATWRWPVAQETYRLGGSGRFTSVTRFGCDCLPRAARPSIRRPSHSKRHRFREPGACRRPDRELNPAGRGCLQRARAREVGAGSCEQSVVCQSVVGIAVAEMNRCLRISAPGAWTVAARHQSSGLAGTFQGQPRGQSAGA